MEAILVSLATVAAAEMGDRTQLLALLLAVRYRRPWPILAGILLATLANHAIAAALGSWFGGMLTPRLLNAMVGASMLAIALWTLLPEHLGQASKAHGKGAFMASLVGFFLAEIGDKTQIATMALAAGYASPVAVVAGTTTGMLLADAPVVLLGQAFAARLPMKPIRYGAAMMFLVLGALFLLEALLGMALMP